MAGMHRKFVTNLFFLVFLNILVKPFWLLGIDVAVQNRTGAAEYGLYSSLLSFTFILNILLDIGITNYNNRNIARHTHLLKKHFASIVALRMILAIAYIIISLAAGYLMNYDTRRLYILAILLLNQIFASYILYLRSNISGLQLFKTESIISVLDRTLMIIFCSVLLWSGWFDHHFQIEWFVWAQTIAYAATAVVTFIIVARKASFRRLTWNPAFFLVILKQSYPYALVILLMAFYYRIDAVMIERLLPDGAMQAGIYAQAFRLLESANQFAYLISVLLLPMFSSMIRQKQSPEELVELSFSFIAVPSIILMAVSVFYNENIMQLLYHNHVEESAVILRVVINSFLAMSSVYIFGTLLTANGSVKELNIIAACGMMLNIALNFHFIPEYGALGGAISGLITQYVTAAAQMFIAHRMFNFTFRWGLFTRYILYTAVVFLLFGWLHEMNFNWIIACITGAVAAMLISFAFYLLKPRSLVTLMRHTS